MRSEDENTPIANIIARMTERSGATVQYTREAVTVVWITKDNDSPDPVLDG